MIVHRKELTVQDFCDRFSAEKIVRYWFEPGYFAKQFAAIVQSDTTDAPQPVWALGGPNHVYKDLDHFERGIRGQKLNDPDGTFTIYYCRNELYRPGLKHPASFCCVCNKDIPEPPPDGTIVFLSVGRGSRAWCSEHASQAEHECPRSN